MNIDRQSANRTLAAEALSLQVHLNLLNGELPATRRLGQTEHSTAGHPARLEQIPAVTRIHVLLAMSSPAALAEAQSLSMNCWRQPPPRTSRRGRAELLALRRACMNS